MNNVQHISERCSSTFLNIVQKNLGDRLKPQKATKKDELRTRLVEAAEALMIERGLSNLKARDVTQAAGCSLGSLYNAVEDLDELVIRVNSRTLQRLGETLKSAVVVDASAKEIMHALAAAYVSFALENTALWSAIFSHRMPKGVTYPDWHEAEYPVLIAEIIAPLAQLRPDLTPEQLRLRAQTVFASVHGVVQLAVHGRFVGVPLDLLASEVDALVDAMTRGLDHVETHRA